MSARPTDALFATARDVLLATLPHAQAIYAFGSFSRGDAWPGSDLDLAVLLPPGQAYPDKLDLMAKVSERVGLTVDLVNLRQAGLDLIHEVLRDGQLLFTRDAAETLVWEAERMTDYEDFSRRRADLVAMYMREPLRAPQ